MRESEQKNIELSNNQDLKRINRKRLVKYLGRIFFHLNITSRKISFVLCGNKQITAINKQYFKKSTPTDVISFPLQDEFDPHYLGEVVVSVEEAVRVARELRIAWEKELLLYLIHGVLHLLGYDDQTPEDKQKMERKQQKILKVILVEIDIRD